MPIDPKAFILTAEEQKIEDDFENGLYKSVEDLDMRKEALSKIAENTLKRKSITIRPFEQDILKLKAIAFEEWIPYQTKIISILHQYVKNYRRNNS